MKPPTGLSSLFRYLATRFTRRDRDTSATQTPQQPHCPHDDGRVSERNAETEALLQATSESARLFRTVYLSFVLVTMYVLVIAFSADDRILLANGDLVAPIINVALPTSFFFVASPIALLLLHLNLLVQGAFLAQNVLDCRAALNRTPGLRDEKLRTLPSIPLAQLASERPSGVPRVFLTAWAFSTVALLPLVTLGIIQAQFLDFQSSLITGLHSLLLLTDSTLILFLWRKLRRIYPPRHQATPLYLLPTIVTLVGFLVIAHVLSYPVSPPLRGLPLIRELTERVNSMYQLTVRGARLHDPSDLVGASNPCNDHTAGLAGASRSFRYARLTGSVLCHADLAGADLRHADLRGAQLQGANLRNAKLQLADLSGAELPGADLSLALLHGASLTEANLSGADLSFAQLDGSSLLGADLTNADLLGARLSWVNATEAVLRGADMRNSVLVGTQLPFADLRGVHLGGSWVVGASMFEALLHGASFSGANVIGANLTLAETFGVDLAAARFRGVSLGFSKLYGVAIDDETRLSGVVFDTRPSESPFVVHLPQFADVTTDIRPIDVVGFVPAEVVAEVARIEGANETVKRMLQVTSERMSEFPDEAALDRWHQPSLVQPYSEGDAAEWVDLFSMDYCRFRGSAYNGSLVSPGTYGIASESIQRWDECGRCPVAMSFYPLWQPFYASAD